MPTPAEFGRMGGVTSKFVRGRTGTDMEIKSGNQRTLMSSWGGLTLSSINSAKVSTNSSKQNSGPTTSVVAERGSTVNLTFNLSSPSPTHAPGTTPPPSPPQVHENDTVIDVDDASVGSGNDVEEVDTKKNSDVHDKSKRPEKRPRSLSDDETNKVITMLKRQEEVSLSLNGKYNNYKEHDKEVREQIDKVREDGSNEIIIAGLEELRLKLRKIWANTCSELWTDVFEVEELEPAIVSSSIASKTSSGKTKQPSKFIGYNHEEREACVAELERQKRLGVSQPMVEALKVIHTWRGFHEVSVSSMGRWSSPGGTIDNRGKNVGRKVVADAAFDVAVLSKLIVTKIDPKTGDVSVTANVASSFELVRAAAKETRTADQWKNNVQLQNLRFSDNWIRRWMRDMDLTRLRVTSVAKHNLPTNDEVRAHYEAIQKQIDDGGYEDDDVFNPDETATRPGAAPLYQLTFKNMRGAAINPNSMLKFTSMLAGSAAGNMLPSFNIIKCTIRQTTTPATTASSTRGRKVSSFGDLSSSRVLDSLLKVIGFRNHDGWSKAMWKRSLKLKVNGVKSSREYARPYLIHTHTGTVITVHNSGWMDSVGLCMWADVVVKPWAGGKKKLMVWDNCPSHCVEEVIDFFKDIKVEVAFLPKNMTDKLQPMDLAVNGALKARMRKVRGEHLFRQVQKHNAEMPLQDFKPRPPKISDGMLMIIEATYGLFKEQSFKENLSKTFYKVGLAKRDGEYIHYTGQDVIKRKGKVTEPPLQEIIANLALDHTIARAEGDRGVADFDRKDDEDGQEEGDDIVDDWCNEALEDDSYDI
jgi:hypothetical protein